MALRSKIFALFTAIAYFFVGNMSVFGSVLCVGLDGHFAVESIQSEHCNQDDHQGIAAAEVQCSGIHAADCGPCVDIPLISDITSSCRPLISTTAVPCNISAILEKLTFLSPTSEKGKLLEIALPPPGAQKTLLFLSTIVLRI